MPFKYEFVTGVATWTGSESSDWNNAANWTPGIPDSYTEALIPDVSANDPVIGSGQSVDVYSVRIEAGEHFRSVRERCLRSKGLVHIHHLSISQQG